ncbi:MAG: transposase [Sedimentisphaerales bacterium]|nr:transposase [Sedimentisphaerales bacterium]
MAKTLGYMVTWTTYGSWLQGDKRRFVKDGQILLSNPKLRETNLQNLKKPPVSLTTEQKEIVNKAIIDKAQKLQQKLLALAVCKNHVHLVVAYDGFPIETNVRHYKNAALVALRKFGFSGRVWSTGFDKQFCFDRRSLLNRINYVNDHNK